VRSGSGKTSLIFEKKRFWPQVIWVLALALLSAAGYAFRSRELVVASVLAVFLGLNETSRWAYKTNLLICAAAALAGAVVGVFSYLDIVFMLALLSVVCGYLLFFRDAARRFLPCCEDFSLKISSGKNLEETVALAADTLGSMSGGAAVFIAVADEDGGLYLPEYRDEKKMNLKRNGGSVWRVLASGRSYMTNRIDLAKDLPLDRAARSLMSVPLLSRSEKIGVLQLESDQPGTFTDYDLSKLEVLAFVISQALFGYVYEPADFDSGSHVKETKSEDSERYRFRRQRKEEKAPPSSHSEAPEDGAKAKPDLEPRQE